MIKRILSIVLVFTLIFTMVPLMPEAALEAHAATAAETADFSSNPSAAKALMGSGVTWSGDAANGYVLELNNVSFTTTAAVAVVLPENTTLVLQGTNTISSTYNGSTPTYGIKATALTIKEKNGYTGKLTVKGGTATSTGETYGMRVYSGLNIESGTIYAYGGTADRGKSAGISSGARITINGGTVNATGGTTDYLASGGNTGGFSGGIRTGSFTINGGTVNATAGHAGFISAAIYTEATAEGSQIYGGTITLIANNTVCSETSTGIAYSSNGIFSTYGLGIYGGIINIKKAPGCNSEGAGIEIYDDIKLTIEGGKVTINSYDVAIKGGYGLPQSSSAFDFYGQYSNGISESSTLGGPAHIRIKRDDPSKPVVLDIPDVTRKFERPAVGEGYTINYITEYVYAKDGYELRINGREYASYKVTEYIGEIPSLVYVRKKAVPYEYAASDVRAISLERPAAPSGLTAAAETIKGKGDGSISGVKTTMSYMKSGGTSAYQNITADGTLENLKPGTYTFRSNATESKFASKTVDVAVKTGQTLKLTFNANGGSEVSPIEGLSWQATVDVPVSVKDNYVLDGWYPNEDLTGEKLTGETRIEADGIYYAKWKKSPDTGDVKAELISAYNVAGVIPVTIDKFEGLPADIENPVLDEDIIDLSDDNNLISNATGTGYTLADNLDSEDIGKFATWKVIISSDNYGDIIAGVKVTIEDKSQQEAVCTHPDSKLTKVEAVGSDCLNYGHNEYYTCECGKVLKADKTTETSAEAEILDTLGDHGYGTLIAAKEAVHTPETLEAGIASHYQCSVCSKYFTADVKTETTLELLTGDVPSHTYNSEWSENVSGHWHECVCSKKADYEEHTPGAEATATTPQTCTVCDYVINPATGSSGNSGSNGSSPGGGGGGFVPEPSVQEPIIEAGPGSEVILDKTGSSGTIKVEEGYEITDVIINGTSAGPITNLSGLKTGDKVIIVTKELLSDDLQGGSDERLIVRSKMTKLKGKPAIRLHWFYKSGKKLDFDGYEIFRSSKRFEGYGKKPIFDTTKEYYYNTLIDDGKKYFYKVRGYHMVGGMKIYSKWSFKAWRVADC